MLKKKDPTHVQPLLLCIISLNVREMYRAQINPREKMLRCFKQVEKLYILDWTFGSTDSSHCLCVTIQDIANISLAKILPADFVRFRQF